MAQQPFLNWVVAVNMVGKAFQRRSLVPVFLVVLFYLLTIALIKHGPILLEFLLVPQNHLYPAFHVRPTQNWMNDPNGPLYYRGKYHLFFQTNPTDPFFIDKHISWGHVVSDDNMVHWRHLPTALVPSESYDERGVYTGSAFLHPISNEPILLFTGNTVNDEVQCFAHPDNASDPDLTKWHKDPRNPIIKSPYGRDPTSLRAGLEQGDWFVQYGSAIGKKGLVRLQSARNNNLYNWTDEGIFFGPINNIPGYFFECPDLFKFPGETDLYGLKISSSNHDHWIIGRLSSDLKRFEPTIDSSLMVNNLIDHGNSFYASKSFFDPVKNRQVLFGWSKETVSRSTYTRRGWAGMQTLPRIISLSANKKRWLSHPLPELRELRTSYATVPDFPFGVRIVPNMNSLQVPVPSGAEVDQIEVVLEVSFSPPLNLSQSLELSVSVLMGEEQSVSTSIGFRKAAGYDVTLFVEQRQLSIDAGPFNRIHLFEEEADSVSRLDLRVFVDHSIIEAFAADGLIASTNRVYPEKPVVSSTAAALNLNDIPVDQMYLDRFDVYGLDTIWRR